MKTLLSTASLALLLAAAAARHRPRSPWDLTDYSGPTSGRLNTLRQGVADTYAWINKSGIHGTRSTSIRDKVTSSRADRAYRNGQAPTRWLPFSDGYADTEALTGFLAEDKIPDIQPPTPLPFRSDRRGRQGEARALQTSSMVQAIQTPFAAC